MSNSANNRDWSAYYHAIAASPPRKTLLTALTDFERKTWGKLAVDLGCGNGIDTQELIKRGWFVLAIDGEGLAIQQLRQLISGDTNRLQTQVKQFNAVELPEDVDLINASYSLPFCHPDDFLQLWEKIVKALKPGGRFAGQLFGIRDSWSSSPSMTFHSRTQIETLLVPFKIEVIEEQEYLGKTAIGEEKYWHIFHIVACKK